MIGPLEILIVLLIVSYIPALIVTGMKGRWVWFTFGLLLMLPAYVGALLPPKRDSTWAIRRQGSPPPSPPAGDQ